MTTTLACYDLCKTYGRGPLTEVALDNVSVSFAAGEACVLLGPSGSGKTTLLSILGCLLSPTDGRVELQGRAVDFSSPAQLIQFRRTKIGFVFQHAQLLPFLSVQENLQVVSENAGLRRREAFARARLLLQRLDLMPYAKRRPSELSGGQRQRVAVARALLHRPAIVLADEPTAALDWDAGQLTLRLLLEESQREGALLITVTHDTRLIAMFDRSLLMESGRLKKA